MKLSGYDDDLRELPECFLFPECYVVRENDNYYLKSDRFNSLSKAEDVLKEAEGLVRMINGLAKLGLSNWWEIKIATGPKDEHKVKVIDS